MGHHSLNLRVRTPRGGRALEAEASQRGWAKERTDENTFVHGIAESTVAAAGSPPLSGPAAEHRSGRAGSQDPAEVTTWNTQISCPSSPLMAGAIMSIAWRGSIHYLQATPSTASRIAATGQRSVTRRILHNALVTGVPADHRFYTSTVERWTNSTEGILGYRAPTTLVIGHAFAFR
jgi:hypothetical protein